jgi:hypothetical protein
MKKIPCFKQFAVVFCASLLLCGCFSLVDKAGRALDGSAFAEKTTARYQTAEKDMEVTVARNKAGATSLIIALKDYPMMKLRGSFPDKNGEFYLTSLEYLGGSVSGWNEYALELSGTGGWRPLRDGATTDETAVLTISKEIEAVQITAGRIQRHDTRITGGEALTYLRNRRERVVAAVEWMASLEGTPQKRGLDDFEEYYKPLLFPEMVSAKRRPSGWLKEGDLRIKAEDIWWNTGYTERVFPEELKEIRNSGTLFRDWEDALSWIYLEYEWGNVKVILSRQNILQKIK